MSTSRPPLIFRVTLPVTTSPSWTVSMTFIQFSIFSALRLLRTIMPRSSCAACDVLDVFDQHADRLADLGRLVAFLPFVARDDAFALVADVDQDELVVDAEDFAFDDLIRRRRLRRRANPCPRAGISPMATFQSSSETSNSRIRLRLTMRKGVRGRGTGFRAPM